MIPDIPPEQLPSITVARNAFLAPSSALIRISIAQFFLRFTPKVDRPKRESLVGLEFHAIMISSDISPQALMVGKGRRNRGDITATCRKYAMTMVR